MAHINTDISSKSKKIPAPFKTIAECQLRQFCTNELGLLVNDTATYAFIGNPLRMVSFDQLNPSQKPITSNSVTALGVNCSMRYMSLVTGTNLCIFDLQKDTILRELHEHDGAINSVTWHKESPWLFATVGDDCTLRLWDLRSHPAQITLRRSTKPYKQLEFSPDCNYIACAGELLSIFNLSLAQNVVHMLSSSPSVAVRFNPSECLIATADEDRTVRFWDVDTGECVTQSPVFDSPIGNIIFEPEGKYLVIGTGKQIASVKWEPYELVSQLNFKQQMHCASTLTKFSTPNGVEADRRSIILDMCIKQERLYHLNIAENSDSMKSSTAYLTCIKLNQFEKCGLSSGTVDTDERIIIESASQSNKDGENSEDENDTAHINPLLDSLIIDQNDNNHGIVGEAKHITPLSDIIMTPQSALLNRIPHHMDVKNSTSSVDMMDQSTEQRQQSLSTHRRRHREGTDMAKPVSLVRRGSSLNDVTFSATEVPHSSTNMPISSVVMANKGRTQSQFSASTASSSSNASSHSNASFLSVGGNGEGVKARKRSESEGNSLEEFMQVNRKITSSVQKAKSDVNKLFTSIRSMQDNKAEQIVCAVSYFEEPHLFAKLLRNYVRQPRSQTLALNATFLPRIDILLKHRNDTYLQLAMEFIEMVIVSFGESIRHGLSSRDFTIGVDVAAEQRFDRCTKCKNSLLQIRLNSSFYTERLDKEQSRRFDNMMSLIDNLIGDLL